MDRVIFWFVFIGMMLGSFVHSTLVNTKSFNPVAPDVGIAHPEISVYESKAVERQLKTLQYLNNHSGDIYAQKGK